MSILVLVLLILAAFSFLLATVGIGGRWNLLALGLFFWVLTQIVSRF
jgi:hypothetical protein